MDFETLKERIEREYLSLPSEKAVSEIGQYLKDSPNDAQAWVLYAQHQALLQDWTSAAKSLENARRLNPMIRIATQLGEAYRKLQRLDEAEAEYTRELLAYPNDPELLSERAGVRRERKNVSGALEDMRAACAAAPQDGAHLAGLALIEEAAGLAEKAIIHWGEVIKLSPRNFMAHFKRGMLAARGERWAMAESDMDAVITQIRSRRRNEFADTLQEAVKYRGWSKFKQGKKGAMIDLDEAVFLNPNESETFCFRALVRVAEKDSNAFDDFERAIECDPKNAFAYSIRGEYHLLVRGDKKAALADFEKAVQLDPDHAAALSESLRLARGE